MQRKQLEECISDLFEGIISEQDFNRLQQELKNNREARALYKQYVQVQNTLDQHAAGANTLASTKVVPINRIIKQQHNKQLKIALISAAAILLVSAALMRLFLVEPIQSVELTFQTSPGTLFTITHEKTLDDSVDQRTDQVMRPGSRLRLSQGTVELNFTSGVRSVITAPADMTLHDEDRLYLREGTAWFHVPEGAEGFQVKTKDLNIVDLGTAFGVLAKANDHDEVHVLEGKIEVTALRVRKETLTLEAGQARRIDPVGRLSKVEAQPDSFLTTLPKTLPYLHLSFDDGTQLIKQNRLNTAPQIDYQFFKAERAPTAPVLSSGKYGNALALNGIGNYLETSWDGILGNRARSIAFWIKIPEMRRSESHPHGRTIIGWGKQQQGKYNIHFNSKWIIHLTPDHHEPPAINISFGGFWYDSQSMPLDDNQWHHIAVVYSGESGHQGKPSTRLYVDGLLCPLESAAHHPTQRDEQKNIIINTTAQTPVMIGASLNSEPGKLIHQNRFLKGKVDEVYIIEGAISQECVNELIQSNQLIHP